LDPVKVVCQIDLASILERGDGDALIGTQRILSENLVKLKIAEGEDEEDNAILLLLPKLETWALAAEMHESDRMEGGGGGGVLTTSKAWDCVAQTVDDCRGRGIENVFLAATCAFDSKHLPKSMRAFFTTKTYSNVGDVLDLDALKMKLAENVVSASFVPAFFRELLRLEEEQEEQEEVEYEDEDDHEEEEEQKEEEKERSDFILLKRLQKENDDISSELRLLTAHLVRLDRLKPFFESEAGRFWRDVDANTCLSSLDEFVESLQLATAKITRGRNPKFILGNGKKMALRSAASYCLDLTEEFIVARGLRQMQKKSDETKKQLTMLKAAEPLNDDDEDGKEEQENKKENNVQVKATTTTTRKRKRRTSSSLRHRSAPGINATIKIKRTVLQPILKAVAEKMMFVTSSTTTTPTHLTVEDVLRERDSLSITLARRAKLAAARAFEKRKRFFFAFDKTNNEEDTEEEEDRIVKKINEDSARDDSDDSHLALILRSMMDGIL
jgi:hypothetical protein